ncbi:MAG: hypothetical protein PHO02_03930 [Candidatus Nanoarchaeia archaeon]|nr:hypothetical protein [Candidatus Nanoarchaeia archaeon]
MNLEMVQQNAKTLMEAIYAYESLIKDKDSKKLETISNYIKVLIASIRKSMQEEA